MNTRQDGPRWGPKGAWAPPGPIFFFFFKLLYYVFYFVVDPPYKTLGTFLSISLANLAKIATIEPKNLTKTIKIFTMVIVF